MDIWFENIECNKVLHFELSYRAAVSTQCNFCMMQNLWYVFASFFFFFFYCTMHRAYNVFAWCGSTEWKRNPDRETYNNRPIKGLTQIKGYKHKITVKLLTLPSFFCIPFLFAHIFFYFHMLALEIKYLFWIFLFH